MDVSHQAPGTFDASAELRKLVDSPDWEAIVFDEKIPLFVFGCEKTGEMKALGDEEACRIALEGWNQTVNSVLSEHRGMNRAQRRKARRK